jgi:hypothetical protein
MSKPAHAIELVDRYLEAVRFWLPKTQRQEEVLAELADDLRSQIEERESELGRRLDNHEVSAMLQRCGPPMVVAARLGPHKYLIGPTLYPIYTFVLKMVLFWILVPVFVFIVGPSTLASTGSWGEAMATTFASLWSGLFIAAGVITLVFAILERTPAQDAITSKWDPLSLPPVRKQERPASLGHTVCELAFNWFGLVWLLLIPHYPALIFGSAAAFLTAGPIWHRIYVPIVLFSVFALVRSGFTLAKPQWTWFPSLSQVLQTVFGLIILRFMLNALGHMAYGPWPFVTLTEAARNSAQYIRVAAIVNVSVLIGLASCWLGFSIALVVHTWKFLQCVRKGARQPPQTAPLGAH